MPSHINGLYFLSVVRARRNIRSPYSTDVHRCVSQVGRVLVEFDLEIDPPHVDIVSVQRNPFGDEANKRTRWYHTRLCYPLEGLELLRRHLFGARIHCTERG